MAKKQAETAGMDNAAPEIHLPAPSYWPIVLAAGMVLMAAGVIFSLIITAVGVVVLLAAIIGWTGENRAAESHEEHHHE